MWGLTIVLVLLPASIWNVPPRICNVWWRCSARFFVVMGDRICALWGKFVAKKNIGFFPMNLWVAQVCISCLVLCGVPNKVGGGNNYKISTFLNGFCRLYCRNLGPFTKMGAWEACSFEIVSRQLVNGCLKAWCVLKVATKQGTRPVLVEPVAVFISYNVWRGCWCTVFRCLDTRISQS